MNPSIELRRVSKYFGSRPTLDQVSFEVRPGQIFALLGDNGAGKTTTIKILLGLLKSDQGTASVLGLNAAVDGRSIRQQIGYVPDHPTLYEWMTVDQIGWFASGFAPVGFLHRYRQEVHQFGLSSRAIISHLSRGMKAKVSLALALARQPEVLVLDEPTSGLDVIVRRSFLESMVDVAASGRTVLLSSHEINEVERVADTVAILHAGKIILCDAVETLKQEIRAVHVDGQCIESERWPGEVITRESKGSQTKLVIRSSPQTDLVAAAYTGAVKRVDVRSASLEEIFVAYVTRSNQIEQQGASLR
ncbi:ABC transporter ATP-binding protein [bacterium]|nr:ABC transporter ATP-binding protein [bacterium]